MLAALKDNYVKRDDAMRVAEVVTLKQEVQKLCVAREGEVNEAIRGELLHASAAQTPQLSLPAVKLHFHLPCSSLLYHTPQPYLSV